MPRRLAVVGAVQLAFWLALAAAGSAQQAEQVRVRAGEHPSFTRLVVDWSKAVKFRLTVQGRSAEIIFESAAKLDISSVKPANLSRIKALTVAAPSGASGLRVTMADGIGARSFVVGTKVVVDFAAVETAKAEPAAKTGEAAKPAPASAKAAQLAATPPFEPAAKPRSLKKREQSQPAPAKETPAAAGDAAAVKRARAARSALSKAARNAVDVVFSPRDSYSPEQKAMRSEFEPLAPQISLKLIDAAALRVISDPNRVRPIVLREADSVRILLPWQQPVPAAALVRSGALWLVFSDVKEVVLDELRQLSDFLTSFQQLDVRGATVLHLRMQPGLSASMRRAQATWTVTLSRKEQELLRKLPAVTKPNAEEGPQVYFASVDNGERIRVLDSDIGDRITFVPTSVSGAGVSEARRFVDFQVLQTVQGIAVIALVDKLKVRAQRDRVIVTGSKPLNLSTSELLALRQSKPAFRAISGAPILDLEGWRGDKEKYFEEKRSELVLAKSLAGEDERNDFRWRQAQFFLAHGLVPEARGFFRLIDSVDPDASDDHAYRAARGVTFLLSGRYNRAGDDLLHSDLDTYGDVALWRGVYFHHMGEDERAARIIPEGLNALQEMPVEMQRRVLEAWLASADKIGDDKNLAIAANALAALVQDPRARSVAALYRGRRAERGDQLGTALTNFETAIATDYRPIRARAALDRIRIQRKLEQISDDDVVKQMERLFFAWRGDDFELKLVNDLAELHVTRRNYRDALGLLRNTVARFERSPATKAMTNGMREIFERLFLDGEADKLEPVQALAIYYDFQELTPVGSRGDEVIRRLADRLVSVDLLARAARLLEHQVNFRLKASQRARVGARLAVIQLLDKQPSKALEALKKSAYRFISNELKTERDRLEIRALADLGKAEEALAKLQGDNSRVADLLRLDIAWQRQAWNEAAGTLEKLLAGGSPGVNLSRLEQRQVTQLAVARYMAGDTAALEALKQRYNRGMGKSSFYQTFKVLTHSIDPSKTKFRDLPGAIARVADFESFLESYRTKLRGGGISAIN